MNMKKQFDELLNNHPELLDNAVEFLARLLLREEKEEA